MSLEFDNFDNIDDFDPEKLFDQELEEYGVWVKNDAPVSENSNSEETPIIEQTTEQAETVELPESGDIFDMELPNFTEEPIAETETESKPTEQPTEQLETEKTNETTVIDELPDFDSEDFNPEAIFENIDFDEINGKSAENEPTTNTATETEEVDLGSFFDSPSTSTSSNSGDSEEISLDDFGIDFSSSESISLDDFMGQQEEKNDIVGDDPINIDLSFDDNFTTSTIAKPEDEIESDVATEDTSFISTGDDVFANFDDIFDNITEIGEPEPKKETTTSIAFDDVSEFDDLLNSLSDDAPAVQKAVITEEEAKIQKAEVGYDLQVSLDENEIVTNATIEIEDDTEDFEVSLYSDIDTKDFTTADKNLTKSAFSTKSDTFSIADLDDSITFVDETEGQEEPKAEQSNGIEEVDANIFFMDDIPEVKLDDNIDNKIEENSLDENAEIQESSTDDTTSEEQNIEEQMDELNNEENVDFTFEDTNETNTIIPESEEIMSDTIDTQIETLDIDSFFDEPAFDEVPADEPVAETETFDVTEETLDEDMTIEPEEISDSFDDSFEIADETLDVDTFDMKEDVFSEDTISSDTFEIEDDLSFETPTSEDTVAEDLSDMIAGADSFAMEEPIEEEIDETIEETYEEPEDTFGVDFADNFETEDSATETVPDELPNSFEETQVIEEEITDSFDDTPAAEDEITDSFDEMPAVEDEITDSFDETPAIEDEITDSFDETPAVEDEITDSFDETPAIEEEITDSFDDTPAVEDEITDSFDEMPAVEEEIADSFDETPAVEDEITDSFGAITEDEEFSNKKLDTDEESVYNIVSQTEENEQTMDINESETINTMGNSLLEKIVTELNTLKSEMAAIKEELNSIKNDVALPDDSVTDELPEIEDTPKSGGFFSDDEEDETIALSGDELNNILSSANFTQEVVDNQADDFQDEPATEDAFEAEETTEQDSFDIPEETLSDDDSFYEEDDEAPVLDISDEQLSEPAIDDIQFNMDEPEQEEVTSIDDGFVVESSNIDLLEDEPTIEETLTDDKVSYLSEDEEIVDAELDAEEEIDIPAIEDDIDASDFAVETNSDIIEPVLDTELESELSIDEAEDTISDEIDINEPELTDEPVVEDEIEDTPTAEVFNSQWDEPEVSETVEEEPAIEEPTTETVTEPVAEATDNSMTSELKSEVKSVLEYMDQLLENLPEEKIAEFARSEHFETYKKLFTELGLA